MKRILVDTSAYSAFMRGSQTIGNAIRAADEIVLNAVVLGELRSGFSRGDQQARNERELLSFLDSPRVSTVSIDDESSDRYAIILASLWIAGTPVPTNDIWIAASAMQHGLRVLTTDEHYLRITQIVVDYFGAAS
jgi:predicted nucleic acid-binding protein